MENQTQLPNVQTFLKEAWSELSFQALTPVQSRAIPAIMEGKDLIVESPTGTGKTLAYLIPLMDQIDQLEKKLQVVILAPTRELVMQIHQEILRFSKGSTIQTAAFIGGADLKRQIEKLKKHPQIIVGTPGRILELSETNKLKLHSCKSIVIDEADQMMQQGFFDSVQAIIKKTLKERQLLFFSATIPQSVEQIGKTLMKDPIVIRIESKDTKGNVQHFYVISEQRDKIDVLRRISHLKECKKAIVFVAESKKMDDLISKLRYKGLQVECLLGDTSKLDRERVIRLFRENKVPILVTTDVAARGLDFQDVTHVIHFDLPEECDKYIHRSGRTGRMGKSGTVISIITNREVGRMSSFAKSMGVPIEERFLYQGNLSATPRSKANKEELQKGNHFKQKNIKNRLQ